MVVRLIGDGHGVTVRQRMIRRHHGNPRFGEQRVELETRPVDRQSYYADVGAPVVQDTVTDPAAGDLLRTRFLDHRREVVLAEWQRGIDRGEVDPASDFHAVNDVLFGPIIFRLVSGHAPLNPDEADLIADVALRGVLAH